jgi:hypothetical protein
MGKVQKNNPCTMDAHENEIIRGGKRGRDSSCWYILWSPYTRLYSEGHLGPLLK